MAARASNGESTIYKGADGRWQGPRPSKLDAFKPYLDQHAGEGHGSITRLFREIQAAGGQASA